jgi:hypothetical protein
MGNQENSKTLVLKVKVAIGLWSKIHQYNKFKKYEHKEYYSKPTLKSLNVFRTSGAQKWHISAGKKCQSTTYFLVFLRRGINVSQ